MDAKLKTLQDVFQNRFSQDGFLKFSTEFFGNLKYINPSKDILSIPAEYKYTVALYRHLATYSNGNDTLDIFAVKLNRGRTIERARSMQRSFISKLLSNTNHDAAIVAFYNDDDPRWRLSFIRLDYEFSQGRVKMKLTPAKRYSYLVGEKEPCHTAMAQLYPIFLEENFNPTLDRIEAAFSVERVTKDFFEQYREKYFELKEYLDSSKAFKGEALRCGFTSEQFAKKLMGQLAFLYFLQKKGWLGVKGMPHTINEKEYRNAFYRNKASKEIIPPLYRKSGEDEYKLYPPAIMKLSISDADIAASCFKSEEWGKGEKAFVRHLFTSCKNHNFFDEYLEPLFYEALNQKRGNSSYYQRFNCKIPFLNGGLFEPLENYDWQHIKFAIPNELFSNIDSKGNREADGILDFFDRYNFTMNEDEPLEREVAVDPEMLGKIFENLLDTNDRKAKGAFYTPREIVHYMCAESLVHYLINKTAIQYEDMKAFIIDGEFMKDEDYNNSGQRRLPQSVFDNLRAIDEALKTIAVADPAVGSGAFPLGMLSEIVKARNNITYYYASQLPKSEDRARLFEQREPYRLKWETIQNCIFAVDIEASAVDIAKLRLWLSLVVDEDLSPSFDELRSGTATQRNPRPLPNLDYNIMCGNSLVDEFEGIQLFDERLLSKDGFNATGAQTLLQYSLFMDSMQIYLDDLHHEQERLFGEQNPEAKHEIKKHIDSIIDNIIRAKLNSDNNIEGLHKYEESLKQKTKPYFLWKLEFARVFREKGGFDIVIGNPPYGLINKKQNKHSSINASDTEQKYYKQAPVYQPAKGGMLNIYRLFVCLSHSLLVNGGNMSLIFPMAYMCDLSAANLRKFIINNAKTLYIEAFPERDNEKKRVFEAVKMSVCILGVQKSIPCHDDYFQLRINQDRFVDTENPVTLIRTDELHQIDPNSLTIPIATQLEYDLFVKITHNCERLGEISKCFTGEIDLSLDKKYIETSPTNYSLIRGAQVQKYRITNEISQGEILYLCGDDYLANVNSPRSQHHNYRRIVMQGITGVNEITRLKMTMIEAGAYCANSVNYIIPQEDYAPLEFLLGLLNSKLVNWFFAKLSTNSNVNGYEVDNIPVRKGACVDNIVKLASEILSKKQKEPSADTAKLEAEIDSLVYSLYNLSAKEIEIVKS
jgi:Alw26I/Eco31I/Esp3I family type II restriction m6 adenine DNA methyltransferase